MLLLGALAISLAGCQSHRSPMAGPMVCTLPQEPTAAEPAVPGRPDLTGSTRIGKASFYARSFANRVMANGQRMNPRGNNAASRTLPLGSTAKVINLQTGQTAVVSIEDRGPYVQGRIVDLSPATARKIGITRRIGIAQVKVAPITVALPDGSTKSGSGAPRHPSCTVYTSSAQLLAAVNREPEHAFSVVAAR
jgi:rare lipoprotein A